MASNVTFQARACPVVPGSGLQSRDSPLCITLVQSRNVLSKKLMGGAKGIKKVRLHKLF